MCDLEPGRPMTETLRVSAGGGGSGRSQQKNIIVSLMSTPYGCKRNSDLMPDSLLVENIMLIKLYFKPLVHYLPEKPKAFPIWSLLFKQYFASFCISLKTLIQSLYSYWNFLLTFLLIVASSTYCSLGGRLFAPWDEWLIYLLKNETFSKVVCEYECFLKLNISNYLSLSRKIK